LREYEGCRKINCKIALFKINTPVLRCALKREIHQQNTAKNSSSSPNYLPPENVLDGVANPVQQNKTVKNQKTFWTGLQTPSSKTAKNQKTFFWTTLVSQIE
jgi:hypothetical protein